MRWGLLGVLAGILVVGPTAGVTAKPPACAPPTAVNSVASILGIPAARVPIQAIRLQAFYRFCREEPQAIACAGAAGGRLSLREVRLIDAGLRAEFEYRDDILEFGRGDEWRHDVVCGDCEDYALTLSERLSDVGQGGDGMAMVIWFTDRYTGHATLAVDTSDAGTVEIGVGSAETPDFMVWSKGVRVGVMRMDGRKQFTAAPGWPAPRIIRSLLVPGSSPGRQDP